MRIGFIGLGAMGLPMARNLIATGHEVTGFDLSGKALSALAEAGGSAAASAAEAARRADMLVLMVVNAAQAEAVLFESGALDTLAPHGIVCLMATCPPAAAVEAIAARVLATQRRFVDAPVSGGVAGATAGTLTIMAAAPRDTFATAEPALRAMGKALYHLGEAPGQGAMVKVVNQLLCGVHLAAAAEALALAGKVGVDRALMLELLGGSAAGSWMLRDRGPRMLQDDPQVTSAVDIFVKDLGIVLEAGRGAKVATPLAAMAHQMFLSASAQGLGRTDDSQVIRTYDRLNTGG